MTVQQLIGYGRIAFQYIDRRFVYVMANRGSRQKRVSDQRLAELQTLLAIARLKGKMTSSSGKYYGYVDPSKMWVY